MARTTQNRRRKLLVNKPLQSKLILNISLVPALGLAVTAVVTAIYCTKLMDEAMATDSELPNLMPLFYLVIAFELLAGFFLLFNALKESHRIAGPAYRICKSIERIRSGDLAFTVKLRQRDHLTDVADELNRLLDYLNENPPPGAVTRATAPQETGGEQPVGEGQPAPEEAATPSSPA